MKKLMLLALCIVSLSFNVAPGGPLTGKERATLLKELTESKDYFMKATQGLSSTQAQFKASPDKWSALQCMEHIAIAEAGIMGYIQQMLKSAPDSTKRDSIKLTDEQVLQMVPNRTNKFQAPEFLQPTGKFKTVAEATAAFLKAREDNIKFVESTQDDLRNHMMAHPAMGMLDCYQWMLLVSAHSRRHTAQIEEVKSATGFPKNLAKP